MQPDRLVVVTFGDSGSMMPDSEREIEPIVRRRVPFGFNPRLVTDSPVLAK